MTRILARFALSKHRSLAAKTFIDFSFQWQCKLGLEVWYRYRAKSKLNWNRTKSCSASQSLLWAPSLILDLSQKQPTWKRSFSWKVPRTPPSWKLEGDFEETSNLILVDASSTSSWYLLTLSWHWTVLRRCPPGGGWNDTTHNFKLNV